MSRLLSLFSSGLVITDGAWGTQFQKRGLAIGEPADVWNLTRPADVEAVAQSYVEAGSRVILTNTFRGNPVALSAHGQGDRAVAINRRGAELSKQQTAAGVRVFASLGPTGKVMATGEIDEQSVTDAFRIQAEALAEGGADGLLFETFSDVEEAPGRASGEADRAAHHRLVRVRQRQEQGPDHDGRDSRNGRPSHGRGGGERDRRQLRCGARVVAQICRRLKDASGLPVWIKPNAGMPSLEAGQAVYTMTADTFASHVPALIEAGASFLGGCCGTSPEFVRALRIACSR